MLAFFSLSGTLLILFALVFMVLLSLTIVGAIIYILRRNNKNREVWRMLAGNSGLSMRNPKQLAMEGMYNDCEIRLAIGVRRHGGENSSTEYYTYCVTDFPYPLRFLLNIKAPKGLLSGVFQTNKLILGQPNFDQSFTVSCYDQTVLQRLLLADFPSGRSQNLMGDLMLARNQIGIINISDEKVYLERSGQVGDERVLRQMLDLTTYLAKRFQTAREIFPLAEWERQLVENWQKIAIENKLSFDQKHIQMQGTYQNFPVLIALKTNTGRWQTQIKLKFPGSLMIGIKLMPENSIHKAMTWLGVQDIEVGIKEFDDAFIVKAKNIQMAKHKLTPDVCQKLVALSRRASDFLIDDETMSFTYESVIGDEKMLKSYLEAMISIAKMMNR